MGKTIKVFEHEYLPVGDLFTLHHWQKLGEYNAKNKNKFLTLLPAAVKFKQYVGAIQTGDLTIEILPKADRNSQTNSDDSKVVWHKVLLSMLKECSLIKLLHPEFANLNLYNNSVLDLYLSLFLYETQQLLHQGLIKKYHKVEGNQPALKGQLLFKQQATKNIVHKERFYVRNSVYDKDHLIHQVLYKAIKVVSKIASGVILKGKAERLLLEFPEQKDIKIDSSTFQKILVDRKSARYSEAILISKMILLNFSPDITGGSDHILALLFDMNKLWEEYVYRQLKKVNTDWDITIQTSHDFWTPSGKTSKTLHPDIIINNHENGKLVIDTKWKVIDGEYPSDEDLRQIFAYAHYANSQQLILLYPSISKQLERHLGTFIDSHLIIDNISKIQLTILKVPLKWKGEEFLGLDLNENDFKAVI